MKIIHAVFAGIGIALALAGCRDEGASAPVTAPAFDAPPASGPAASPQEAGATKPRPSAPVVLDDMAELVFETAFDIEDRTKTGEDVWNQLRREFADLYAAEMKKSAFDAFEQPFEDAMEALRKKYGVAEPKHE